jgi:hypothetical protein
MTLRLPSFVDERFLMHRLRASSLAGIVTAVVTILLCGYRFYHDHVIDVELLSIALTFIVVKYAAFAWYRLKQ